MTIESQRSPMPFCSWLRTTRATSTGRIYASTVGCLPPSLWSQESLCDRLLPIILVATRAGTAGSALSVFIFLSCTGVSLSVAPYVPFTSRIRRAMTRLNACEALLGTLATGPFNPDDARSRRGALIQIRYRAYPGVSNYPKSTGPR